MRSLDVAAVVLVLACQSAAAPTEPSARPGPPSPTGDATPALDLNGRLSLEPAGTLGLGGRQIVAVWDTANWRAPPMAWAAHDQPTGGIAFHPSAPLLVTTGFDRTVKLWRLGAPPVLVASAPLAGLPLAVAFTPNGQRLYVGVDHHDNITESIVIFALAPGA